MSWRRILGRGLVLVIFLGMITGVGLPSARADDVPAEDVPVEGTTVELAPVDDTPVDATGVEEALEVSPGPSTIAPEALAKADPAATGSGAPPEEFTSGNLVGDTLRDLRRRDRSWFNLGLRDAAVRIEEMVEKRIGLRFGAAYTMLYQGADRGSGPKDAWGGDLDIVGIWKPKGQRKGWEGSLQPCTFEPVQQPSYLLVWCQS